MAQKELEKHFKELLVNYKVSRGNAGIDILKNTWKFAKLAHIGQKRLTGDPYASHSLAVAAILFSWKLDLPSIVAGFLHDTIEDGGAASKDIIGEFGEEVNRLVEGVTKVSNVRLRGSQDEEFIENLRKMFLAMAKDLRVVLIKLADRLHNMQTLYALPKDKQLRIARETLEVFAPLAERLGMGQVKAELDDLAFPYVYPEEHEKVVSLSKPYYKNTEKDVDTMKRKLLKVLAASGLKSKVSGRKKHLY